jgi:hypothetical protein
MDGAVMKLRRLPARIGATVIILHGEGYHSNAVPRPRRGVRFLAGEFGTIVERTPDWYREWTVELPPHPDWPEDGPRRFMFKRDEIMVLPRGTVPNTSAMDGHNRGRGSNLLMAL